MGTTAEKLQAVLNSKTAIKEALENKGKNPTDVFSTYAGLIENITEVTFADPAKLTDAWQFAGHTDPIKAIAVDADGYIYSCGNDNTVKKLKPDGVEVWSFTEHTNWVYGLALDENNYIYTASGDNTIKKINSDGTKETEYDYTAGIRDIKIGSDGFIYAGCAGGKVLKLTKDLVLESQIIPHNIDVNGVAVAPDGHIYTCSADGSVRKSSQDGTQVWSFTGHTGAVNYITIDEAGYIYSVSTDSTLKKIDPKGTEIWSVTLANSAYKVDIDVMGNIYVAGNSGYIRKINPDDGSIIWEYKAHTSVIRALTVGIDNYIYSGGGSKLKKTHHHLAVAGTLYEKPTSGNPIPQNVVQIMEAQAIEASDVDIIIPAGTFLSGNLTIKALQTESYWLTNADETQRTRAVLIKQEIV